jgi:hypothetical protein
LTDDNTDFYSNEDNPKEKKIATKIVMKQEYLVI